MNQFDLWAEQNLPRFTYRWSKTHVFLQQHGIYDVWHHVPSGIVLVQCELDYLEMYLDVALKTFFTKHTPAHDRLSAIKAMTDE